MNEPHENRRKSQKKIVGALLFPGFELLVSYGALDLMLVPGGNGTRREAGNKPSFALASSQSTRTQWVPQARWIADGNVWTSGGVAAGIDMSLALFAAVISEETAIRVAEYTEYEWHRDAGWDPFAQLAGLIDDRER